MQINSADIDRFNAKVADPDENGCMLWTAYTDGDGYGRFSLNGKPVRAHQFAMYAAEIYPESDDLQIDHLCRVRSCQNPDHLEFVTQKENVNRGDVMGNTWNKGHTWNRGNTWSRGEKHGMAKLTEEQVRIIRELVEIDGFTQTEIAKWFGIKPHTVSRVVNRKRWSHV